MAARDSTVSLRIFTTRIRPPAGSDLRANCAPHRFDLNRLAPSDLSDAEGQPVAFLGNADIRLSVSRRSEPMPFYFRNADGDELYFVHRGRGRIETDFGPLDFEPGDYINIPRAVTYRIIPETRDNFFLIIQSKHEFEQPEKGLLGQHALYDPAAIVTPEPAPCWTTRTSGKSASKWTTRFRKWSIRSILSTSSAGRATSRSGRSTCATSGR